MTGSPAISEIEAIERAALEDISAAADSGLRASLKINPAEIGGAFVSAAGGLPASAIVVNRTIGLGAVANADDIAAIAAHYRAAGVARYFVHVPAAGGPAGLAGWLAANGLEKVRGWTKFSRGRDAPPPVTTTLDIRPAVASDADAFGRIESDAFDTGPESAAWLGRLIGRPGWHIYMSLDGDRPAGAGTMFVRDGVAWLDWGATAPDFRGRGGQSAILHRRITDALDLGCRLLATATGEAVPGDPQHSYRNIERMGFAPAYVRPNFAPPKPSG